MKLKIETENWNWKLKLKIGIKNWNWNWKFKLKTEIENWNWQNNLDTVFISENMRVPTKNGMFATYRVDWFPRSFFYITYLYTITHFSIRDFYTQSKRDEIAYKNPFSTKK